MTDSVLGIPSQCIALESCRIQGYNPSNDRDRRSRDQYCANLAMKINVKLGGVNAAPVNVPQWQSTPFMVIGLPLD